MVLCSPTRGAAAMLSCESQHVKLLMDVTVLAHGDPTEHEH